MKLIVRTFILFSICLLLLAGCTNPFARPMQIEQPEDDIKIVADEELEAEAPTKIITCDMLKTKMVRQECNEMVNAIAADLLYSEIRETFDLNRCGELSGDMVEDCKNYVESTGVKGPVSEDQLAILARAMQYSYETTEGMEEREEEKDYYDITKCATLIAPGLKDYCERELNQLIEEEKMYKIINEGDVAECDTLTIEEFKNMCKFEFGVFDEEHEEETTE